LTLDSSPRHLQSSWERSATQFSWASFLSGFVFQFGLHVSPCFRTICLDHFPFVPRKYIDRRFVPIGFSRSCLRPPLLPGFYPHSQGATLGPVHVGVRSQTRPHHHCDGAWLVGCCHLIGDLRGSGHYPQSPEQGEWMSLLQTFPITNRLPRDQSIFCSLGLCLFAIASVNFYGTWLDPASRQPLLVLSWFLPPCDGAVHRHPRSPTGDAATRPAFGPPPPRLASSHSFLRARTIAARIAVSRCPVRRLPTCIANSLPATVVTSGLPPY
jgi:hypothetical protein